MSEERITERNDGVTTERTVERDAPAASHTTVIERRGGGGGGILIGVVLLIAVVVGAYFLLAQTNSEANRDDAIAGAAQQVGESAERVGDAVAGAVSNNN